jgi:hypothetical protein
VGIQFSDRLYDVYFLLSYIICTGFPSFQAPAFPSNFKVLHDAVEAGARIGAIFKEPTITPTAVQVKELGLSKPFGSPNGAMRRGWNGMTISRWEEDTLKNIIVCMSTSASSTL